MKFFPIVILLGAYAFFINSQFVIGTQLENTEISLQVDGLSSHWIYLQGIHKNVRSKLDSTLLDAEGKGLFKYEMPLDPGYYNLVISDDVSFPILLDQDQSFSLKTKMGQLIKAMKVQGSTDNDLLYKNMQLDMELQDRFQAEIQAIQQNGTQQLDQALVNTLREKYFAEKEAFLENTFQQYPNALFTSYERAKQEPQELYRLMADQSLDPAQKQALILSTFWDQVDFSNERLLSTPVIYDKLWQYFNQFVPDQTDIKIQAVDILMSKVMDHPEYCAFFATWLADDYLPPFTGQMDPDALYTHLANNYLARERAMWADSMKVYAWQLRAESRSVSLAGMKAANFEAQTPDGRMQALFDVKSPYIALFFYHYDCDHCIETAPKLAQQYPALKDQGLEVVAVAMDTPEEEWKNFIDSNDMNFINVTDQDNQSIYEHYSVWATPEIMLLGPDRTIIGKHLAVEDISVLMQASRMGMLKKENSSSSLK
ncbi:MAG: redoxin domain-containing protein [Phaeodactylibacter sp.]|nr:redoxin domain-containing protein [Phaeodactylibacter sp.]